ncbi:unnamed protein product [Hymenolepis diminuta]|uniref:Uncharacterized protein n=1 Tax=Hymenolepis diminuta TaxID=6216 RepID=A0A564ZA66_HYMDI|nr:unnamed protein product [Hymenolepis diminuta]
MRHREDALMRNSPSALPLADQESPMHSTLHINELAEMAEAELGNFLSVAYRIRLVKSGMELLMGRSRPKLHQSRQCSSEKEYVAMTQYEPNRRTSSESEKKDPHGCRILKMGGLQE